MADRSCKTESVSAVVSVIDVYNASYKFELTIPLSYTVLQLKSKITQLHPWKPSATAQRLLCNGRQLSDEMIVKSLLFPGAIGESLRRDRAQSMESRSVASSVNVSLSGENAMDTSSNFDEALTVHLVMDLGKVKKPNEPSPTSRRTASMHNTPTVAQDSPLKHVSQHAISSRRVYSSSTTKAEKHRHRSATTTETRIDSQTSPVRYHATAQPTATPSTSNRAHRSSRKRGKSRTGSYVSPYHIARPAGFVPSPYMMASSAMPSHSAQLINMSPMQMFPTFGLCHATTASASPGTAPQSAVYSTPYWSSVVPQIGPDAIPFTLPPHAPMEDNNVKSYNALFPPHSNRATAHSEQTEEDQTCGVSQAPAAPTVISTSQSSYIHGQYNQMPNVSQQSNHSPVGPEQIIQPTYVRAWNNQSPIAPPQNHPLHTISGQLNVSGTVPVQNYTSPTVIEHNTQPQPPHVPGENTTDGAYPYPTLPYTPHGFVQMAAMQQAMAMQQTYMAQYHAAMHYAYAMRHQSAQTSRGTPKSSSESSYSSSCFSTESSLSDTTSEDEESSSASDTSSFSQGLHSDQQIEEIGRDNTLRHRGTTEILHTRETSPLVEDVADTFIHSEREEPAEQQTNTDRQTDRVDEVQERDNPPIAPPQVQPVPGGIRRFFDFGLALRIAFVFVLLSRNSSDQRMYLLMACSILIYCIRVGLISLLVQTLCFCGRSRGSQNTPQASERHAADQSGDAAVSPDGDVTSTYSFWEKIAAGLRIGSARSLRGYDTYVQLVAARQRAEQHSRVPIWRGFLADIAAFICVFFFCLVPTWIAPPEPPEPVTNNSTIVESASGVTAENTPDEQEHQADLQDEVHPSPATPESSNAPENANEE